MTLSGQMRSIGFRARLTQSGAVFTLPDGFEVEGLVEPVPPPGMSHPLNDGEREGTAVYFLREDLEERTLAPQQSLVKDGCTYRITDVDDHPDNITVKVTTELGKPVA
jgi:hypothetical protein